MGVFHAAKEGRGGRRDLPAEGPGETGAGRPAGTYEKVLDPIALRPDGTTSFEMQGFSPDGKLMLYSIRDGGPDEISLHIRDLVKNVDLPDSLPWALYGSASLSQTHFTFKQLPELLSP